MVVRRYQKQTAKSGLPGKTQAPGDMEAPGSDKDKEPASGAKASKERASGSTQPLQVDEPQVSPGSSAGKPSATKAKQKKAPFYKAKAEARSSGEVQAGRPAVILTEGRGASRPGKQDDEEDKAGDCVTLKEGPGVTRPTEEEAVSPKAGSPKETRTRDEGDETTRPREPGVRTLAIVKEEQPRFQAV